VRACVCVYVCMRVRVRAFTYNGINIDIDFLYCIYYIFLRISIFLINCQNITFVLTFFLTVDKDCLSLSDVLEYIAVRSNSLWIISTALLSGPTAF